MIIIDTILLFTRTRPTEEFYGLSQVIFTYNSTGNQKFHQFCKMILYAKRQEKPCPQNFLRPVTVISSRMDAFVILPGRNIFLVNTFGTLFEKESKRINKQKKKQKKGNSALMSIILTSVIYWLVLIELAKTITQSIKSYGVRPHINVCCLKWIKEIYIGHMHTSISSGLP